MNLQEAQQRIDTRFNCWGHESLETESEFYHLIKSGRLIVTCDQQAFHPEMVTPGDSGGPLLINISDGADTRYVF